MWPGRRPTSVPNGIFIHPAVWPQRTLAENWGCAPFGGGGAGSPCNLMWPGPRPTTMPSFILVHPTVWPQYTNVTDRTDRQRTDSVGEPFYKRSPKNRFSILQNCKVHAFKPIWCCLITVFIAIVQLFNAAYRLMCVIRLLCGLCTLPLMFK